MIPGLSRHNSLIGDRLGHAMERDFFRWFHLEIVGRGRDADGFERVDFRPSGERFHAVVLLSAWLGADERIQRLRLALTRTFVSHPHDGMFARDITKSLLLAASRPGDPPDLAGLIDEIEFDRAGVSVPEITAARRHTPALPLAPSAGYSVYLGRTPAHEIAWPGGRLDLRNIDDPSGSQMVIALA